MTLEGLAALTAAFADTKANTVPADKARRSELAGMRMYGVPALRCARADDEYILSLCAPNDAGLLMLPPGEWLPSARTVISVFLPATEQVRRSNRGGDYPSDEWVHARIEGQAFIDALMAHLCAALTGAGFEAAVPFGSEQFASSSKLPEDGGPRFTSNWSERHVAYACGQGTFSLHRGLITEQGCAGRFGSLVTSLELPATPRPYTDLTEWCTLCGACARNCPAAAIDMETGKDHVACSRFLNAILADNRPYYGCGKCQCAVPCEAGVPGAKAKG